VAAHVGDQVAHRHHRRVKHSQVTLDLEVTLLGDSAKFHEHVSPWNSHLVEACPTVILAVITYLGAHVASLYTW
jgi:hypothetical protein